MGFSKYKRMMEDEEHVKGADKDCDPRWRLYIECADDNIFIHMHPDIEEAIKVIKSLLICDEYFAKIIYQAIDEINEIKKNN